MRRISSPNPWWTRLAAVAGLVLAAAARAEMPPWLPAKAFQLATGCGQPAFRELDADDLERRLARPCLGRGTLAPRLGMHAGGAAAQAWIGQRLQWRHRGVSARLLLDMAAQAEPHRLGARTELGAGLWWRPSAPLALGLRLGGRVDDQGRTRQRVALLSAWRPWSRHLVFARWHASGRERLQTEDALQELGWRWWLQRERISLDLLWPADRERAPGRLTLAWRGLRL